MMLELPPLLETRRPPRSTLKEVQEFLASDRMLFVAKHEDLTTSIAHLLAVSLDDDARPLPAEEGTLSPAI